MQITLPRPLSPRRTPLVTTVMDGPMAMEEDAMMEVSHTISLIAVMMCTVMGAVSGAEMVVTAVTMVIVVTVALTVAMMMDGRAGLASTVACIM